MVISTRSKTGSRPSPKAAAPAPAITKPAPGKATAKPAAKPAAKPTATSSSGGPKLLPERTLVCDDGERRAVHSLLSDDTPGLILFTYPRANTGGCTAQAVGLSAFADEAASLGYALAGASYDSAKSQASWKAKKALKCRLLCDTLDVGLLKKLNAHKAPKGVKRSVFVVRRGGEDGSAGTDPVIVLSRVTISPKDSIAVVQEYVRAHPCNGDAKADEPMIGAAGADEERGGDAEAEAGAEGAKEESNGEAKGAENGAKGGERKDKEEEKDSN